MRDLAGERRRGHASRSRRAWSTRSPSCSPASRSTAPTCPRAASTSTTPSPTHAGGVPTSTAAFDRLQPAAARPPAPGRPALPADQRHGDGQGRRGLRVLPLLAAHLAQRGRRRPERLRDCASASSTTRWRRARRTGRTRMTALSTHDTKRGEDVRARITVLAEIPDEWETALDRAARPRAAARPGLRLPAVAGGARRVDRDAGRGPARRLHAYAEKAMREAGDRTTWTEPDEAYEAAVHAAVDAAFDDDRRGRGARGPARTGSTAGVQQRPRGQAASR